MKRALWLLAVAACGTDEFVIVPQIDTPANQDVLGTLDRIRLVVKHANGSPIDTDEFERGQSIELPNIPFSDDIVVEIQGFRNGATVVGGRTCPFKVSPNEDPPTPHLYLSELGSVGRIELSTEIRTNGAALANPDNTVVLLGGDGVQSLETFDPLSGQKLPDTGLVFESRTQATIARLSKSPGIPRPVIIGGILGGLRTSTLEVLNVEASEITTLDGGDTLKRTGAIATELTDGRILVTGGKKDGVNPGEANPTGEVALVDFKKNENEIFIDKKTETTTPRIDHIAVRMGDDDGAPVLIVGGVDDTGALVATAELFKPLNDDVLVLANATLKTPRRSHKAVVIGDNSAVIIGGLDSNNQPVRQLERFSFIDGVFNLAGQLPGTAGAIDFSVTPLPDGRVLLTGGRTDAASPPLDRVFLLRFDPDTDTVTIDGTTQNLAVPRAKHQAVLLCDGTVLITGGTDGPSPAERFNAIVFAQ